jgi:hypothetical protein
LYPSAPVKIPEKPVVSRIEGSKDSVNITWLPPINNSGIDETVVYDIVCNICAEVACNKSCGDVCSKPCADLSYSPSQHNVTETRIRVSGLVNKRSYQFKIVAKNSLNTVVPRKKWKFVSSDPYEFSSKGINTYWLHIILDIGSDDMHAHGSKYKYTLQYFFRRPK